MVKTKVKQAEKEIDAFKDKVLPELKLQTQMAPIPKSSYDISVSGQKLAVKSPDVRQPTIQERVEAGTLVELEKLKAKGAFKDLEKINAEVKDFAIGCIPVYGSGRDITRGWTNNDWLLFSFGCVGLGLDVVTPGVGKTAAKGIFKTIRGGVKVAEELGDPAMRAISREVIENATRKGVKNELKETFGKVVTATTGKEVVDVEKFARSKVFEIGQKMMRYDTIHNSGQAVYETATKFAKKSIEKGVKKMSVLLTDLNNFKKIDDILGRDTADKVIDIYERELNSLLKNSTSVGYGREEITTLVPSGATEVRDIVSILNKNINKAIDELGPLGKEIKEKLGKEGIKEITAKIGICEIPVGQIRPQEVWKEFMEGGIKVRKKVLETEQEFSERLFNHMRDKVENAKSAGELSKVRGNTPTIFTNEINIQKLKLGAAKEKTSQLLEYLGMEKTPENSEAVRNWVLKEKSRVPITDWIKNETIQELKNIKGGEGIFDELCGSLGVYNVKGTREKVVELAKSGKPFTVIEITGGIKYVDRTLKTMNNTLEGYTGGDNFIKLLFSELEKSGYTVGRRGSSDWGTAIKEGIVTEAEVETKVTNFSKGVTGHLSPGRKFTAAYSMKTSQFKEVPEKIEDLMTEVFKEANDQCKVKWELAKKEWMGFVK